MHIYTEDELLPISALVDIVFCERRAALHQIEQIWEENVATVEGQNLHDKIHHAEGESRGNTRIARGLLLRSLRLGLTGKADVVEFHRSEGETEGVVLPGAAGRWTPFPVEYKRGIRRHEESFEVQLCAQAMCLEEMLDCSVEKGAVFYGMSRRRQDVAFSEQLRSSVEKAAVRLHELLASGKTPEPRYAPRCKRCSLYSICMPRLTKKTVAEYMAQVAE